jgi:hypothetical protein
MFGGKIGDNWNYRIRFDYEAVDVGKRTSLFTKTFNNPCFLVFLRVTFPRINKLIHWKVKFYHDVGDNAHCHLRIFGCWDN